MNKNIENLTTKEFENLTTLGLDDTFEFSCRECGKCCKYNRNDILLTPYDLFRIASYFGRTPIEILERYCEVYEGHTSHLPVVRVLPVPPTGSCPFLRGRKCAVHAKKPVLCRTYPLAKIHTQGKTRYYDNGASCKHTPKPITVREWLADIASDEAEKAGALWWEVIGFLIPLLQAEKPKVTVESRRLLLAIVFSNLYLSYEIKEPFLPQLQKNFEEIKRCLPPSANI